MSIYMMALNVLAIAGDAWLVAVLYPELVRRVLVLMRTLR
jgi:hypothetical protein